VQGTRPHKPHRQPEPHDEWLRIEKTSDAFRSIS
jgi:hypothetical protein